MNVLGDTTVTPSVQIGMKIVGQLMTRLANDASPTDDTPSVITQDEKLGALGEVALGVVGALGK